MRRRRWELITLLYPDRASTIGLIPIRGINFLEFWACIVFREWDFACEILTK